MTNSHPPNPPDSRKRQRIGTDQLAESDADGGKARQHRRGGARSSHTGIDAGKESFPLDQIPLRGLHQRPDGQAMRLRELPAHREPLPLPGQ